MKCSFGFGLVLLAPSASQPSDFDQLRAIPAYLSRIEPR